MTLTITVSQLNSYIKTLMEADEQLYDIAVRGEISNYTVHSSGHHYFTLKDKTSSLKCVMFRREAAHLQFRPQTGMSVLAGGRITVYEAGGQYQLYASWIQPDGIGAQFLALEELKKKLSALGYMDENRKKLLPPFPQCVGVVTSPTGAAWHDIQKVAKNRWPAIELILFPALVQGDGAPEAIAQAIAKANASPKPEVLIVGRGGGSMEDLWCFNTEEVAMAIIHSRLPVVSAVGHEVDFTLADLVADRRAATPSAAAEIVVPDSRALEQKLSHLEQRIKANAKMFLDSKKQDLRQLQSKAVFTQPQLFLEAPWRHLENSSEDMERLMETACHNMEEKITALAGRLHILDPLATLSRGYALCQKADGTLLTRAQDTVPGETITARLAQGSLHCQVLNLKETK